MNRNEAVVLVEKHIKNKNLRKHIYAVEIVMKHLANHFDQDQEEWGLAGILHDLDYEKTAKLPEKHTQFTKEWLRDIGGVSEEVLYAIEAHVGFIERKSLMDKAIYCVDPTTGFLVACALMHPSKKLAALDLEFINRRFNEKRFAAGASREQMATCSDLGMTLDEFLTHSLNAMLSISDQLGL